MKENRFRQVNLGEAGTVNPVAKFNIPTGIEALVKAADFIQELFCYNKVSRTPKMEGAHVIGYRVGIFYFVGLGGGWPRHIGYVDFTGQVVGGPEGFDCIDQPVLGKADAGIDECDQLAGSLFQGAVSGKIRAVARRDGHHRHAVLAADLCYGFVSAVIGDQDRYGPTDWVLRGEREQRPLQAGGGLVDGDDHADCAFVLRLVHLRLLQFIR